MSVSIAKSRAFLQARQDQEQKRLDILYDRALQDCNAIVQMIIDGYQPGRIYQWGSLLDRSKFRAYSDIDLGIEGIRDPEAFFAMLGQAERMTDFALDILDMEHIEPEFAEIIRQKGIIIYDRPD